MPQVPSLFAVLVCLVLLSAGLRTVLAEDGGSGSDESVRDVSSQAELTNKTENQRDVSQASGGDNSDTALKAAGRLKELSPDEVEWVENVSATGDREETDSETVPHAPETNPSNNRTRSGNLDGYYGKSKWCTNSVALSPQANYTD
jgi:hypothetical protein